MLHDSRCEGALYYITQPSLEDRVLPHQRGAVGAEEYAACAQALTL